MAGTADGGSLTGDRQAQRNRFVQWSAWQARFGLLAFALLLVAAVSAGLRGELQTAPVMPANQFAEHNAKGLTDPERAGDLALYDRVVERLRAGENYYDYIVEEQRLSGYPVTPGAAVRLPTLAMLIASTTPPVQSVFAVLLLAAVALAWTRRLRDEGVQGWRLRIALALLIVGNLLLINNFYHVLHEIWAGALLALALGVHRPGRWGASLLIAALAISIRELAVPFVLLMAATAFWRRDWREAAAWAGLTAAFAVAYSIHLGLVAAQVEPTDVPSASWLALGGVGSWLAKLVLSCQLHLLPPAVAGPAAICALVGWAGWRSPAGTFATLLYLGYGLAFMIAGRQENFYWGLIVVPLLYIGFVFAPQAILSLVKAARLDELAGNTAIVFNRHVLQKRRS